MITIRYRWYNRHGATPLMVLTVFSLCNRMLLTFDVQLNIISPEFAGFATFGQVGKALAKCSQPILFNLVMSIRIMRITDRAQDPILSEFLQSS